MKILTLEDGAYDLDTIPEEIDDIRFAILDNSDPANPSYFFIPLIFLESFNAPALVLRVGDQIIKIPMDWHILIVEEELKNMSPEQIAELQKQNCIFCHIISGKIKSKKIVTIIMIIIFVQNVVMSAII